ncbi:unnamed protein product [Leuciscus chuanchicus]
MPSAAAVKRRHGRARRRVPASQPQRDFEPNMGEKSGDILTDVFCYNCLADPRSGLGSDLQRAPDENLTKHITSNLSPQSKQTEVLFKSRGPERVCQIHGWYTQATETSHCSTVEHHKGF